MPFARKISRRRRYLYDDRTGFKVFGADRMQEDGEKRGIVTMDWDEEHPQKYLSVPHADRVDYVPRSSDPASIPGTVYVGFMREEGSGNNNRILVPQLQLAPVPGELLGASAG